MYKWCNCLSTNASPENGSNHGYQMEATDVESYERFAGSTQFEHALGQAQCVDGMAG